MSTPKIQPLPLQERYETRVEELCRFAEDNFGVSQTDMRIIAASLLPTPHSNPVWLIADSPKHEFWLQLARAMQRIYGVDIATGPVVRSLRPRTANHMVAGMLERRQTPRILRDYIFEEPPPPLHPRNMWREVEAECLRLRVRLSWMKTPMRGSEFELQRLLKLVADPEHRPFLPAPMPKPPELLIYTLDLLQRVNPALINMPATVTNALTLPVAHAVLHGRDKLEPVDHEILLRVLQNTVRGWTWKILLAFSENDGAMQLSDLEIQAGLRHELVVRECSRLAECGVLDWPKPAKSGNRRKYLRLASGRGDDIRQFALGGSRWW